MRLFKRLTWVPSLVAYLLTVLALVYASFALPRLLPGDAFIAMYGSGHVAIEAQDEASIRESEIFKTSSESFAQYLGRLGRLDWGTSTAYETPVFGLIMDALPWTLLLMGTAQLLSMGIGFILGVEAAWRHDSVSDRLLTGVMTFLEGIPELSSGVLLLLVFALWLGWFPAAGGETVYSGLPFWERTLDILHHLALPLATLVLAYLPGSTLLSRAAMLMTLRQPFMLTAAAKGLPPWRRRYAHAARCALLPVVTRLGLRLASMLTGVLVVESIHSYPGLGTLLFQAVSMRDLPLISGIVLFSSLGILTVALALEKTYQCLDPRLRQQRVTTHAR